jgi:hypothetical protein
MPVLSQIDHRAVIEKQIFNVLECRSFARRRIVKNSENDQNRLISTLCFRSA